MLPNSSSKQVLSSSWKLIPKLFCCSYALRWVSSDGRGLVTEHIVSHLLCITLWASLCVLNAAYKNPVTSYIFVTANHQHTHKKWMDLEAVLLAPKSSTVFTTFWAWICLFSLRVTEQILVQFSKLKRWKHHAFDGYLVKRIFGGFATRRKFLSSVLQLWGECYMGLSVKLVTCARNVYHSLSSIDF